MTSRSSSAPAPSEATRDLPFVRSAMLRRLESQGLLTSEWREEERRNKRFYRLSEEGRRVLDHLVDVWAGLHASVDAILKDKP